jgi:hypothetical protein
LNSPPGASLKVEDERGLPDPGWRHCGVRALLPVVNAAEQNRRRHERRVPAHPVAVSAEAENGRTTGKVVNISAGGACLALDDQAFAVGDELVLWMHFARPKAAVPATARIVWTAPDQNPARCGLEWTHGGPQRRWIGWLTEV